MNDRQPVALGEALVEPRSHEHPDRFYDSTRVSADPQRFRVAASVA